MTPTPSPDPAADRPEGDGTTGPADLLRGSQTTVPSDRRAVFSERLLPSAAGWFGIVAFAVVLGIALTVAGPGVGVVTGAVTLVVGCAVAWWTAPVIEVRGGVLRAGRTEIPTTLLTDVTTLDREGVRTQMGTEWDARAFACLRTWTGGAVRAVVVDPDDPTPYWVVSTRRPHELAAAVTTRG